MANVLQTLDLRSNALRALSDISSFVAASLLTIFLENNPFVCDCQFSFILEVSIGRLPMGGRCN